MFSLYFLQKPESSAEEQTKPEEKQEVKKSAETLTADIPAPAMESPTTTSKISRKKKKAAAAAAAVAEFAEMLPQEKEEEPSVGSGNAHRRYRVRVWWNRLKMKRHLRRWKLRMRKPRMRKPRMRKPRMRKPRRNSQSLSQRRAKRRRERLVKRAQRN